jgi:hypothetical protein
MLNSVTRCQQPRILLGDFFESGSVANATVTGATTGMTAQLIDAQEGSEAADPNFLTIFVKYTNSGSNNTLVHFLTTKFFWFVVVQIHEFLVAANTITASATGEGFRATVSDGIVYHKGHFIRVAPQSHIVEKYSTTPNKKIGFITTESTVDSNEDSSLTRQLQLVQPTLRHRVQSDSSCLQLCLLVI